MKVLLRLDFDIPDENGGHDGDVTRLGMFVSTLITETTTFLKLLQLLSRPCHSKYDTSSTLHSLKVIL